VQYTAQPANVTNSTLNAIKAAVVPARDAGVQVEYNGSVYPGSQTSPSSTTDLIGLLIAFVILMITFSAFVAAGLPILLGIIGVVIAQMLITGLAAVVNIASASTTVAVLLGLSCGIDYGLFILSRHRNHLLAGMATEDSVRTVHRHRGKFGRIRCPDRHHRAMRTVRGRHSLPDHDGARGGGCGVVGHAYRADPAPGAARLRRRQDYEVRQDPVPPRQH
jgi:hypothetical protein